MKMNMTMTMMVMMIRIALLNLLMLAMVTGDAWAVPAHASASSADPVWMPVPADTTSQSSTSQSSTAQSSTSQDSAYWFDRHLRTTRVGMTVLGGWALANLAVGLVGRARTSGTTRYVHEMNAGWNLVNLGIAGFSLLGQQGMEVVSATQAFDKAQRLDMLLLLNTGLDVAYITAGGYLIERGKRTDSVRLEGYGRSLILQGAFLLVFDLGLFAVHRDITLQLQERLSGVSLHPALTTIAPPGQDLAAVPTITLTIRR